MDGWMDEWMDGWIIKRNCQTITDNNNNHFINDHSPFPLIASYDGLGLSWGILEYIINHIPHCYCLFTTHYYELTTIASHYRNVKNIHVTALSGDSCITMLYGVRDGPSDKSFGINVAQLCNFPKEIIAVCVMSDAFQMNCYTMRWF